MPKSGENPEVKARNPLDFSTAVPHYGSASGSNVGYGFGRFQKFQRIKNCDAETKNSWGKIFPAETIRRENLREQIPTKKLPMSVLVRSYVGLWKAGQRGTQRKKT